MMKKSTSLLRPVSFILLLLLLSLLFIITLLNDFSSSSHIHFIVHAQSTPTVTFPTSITECGPDGKLLYENLDLDDGATDRTFLVDDCDITIRNVIVHYVISFGDGSGGLALTGLNITVENVTCLPPDETGTISAAGSCIRFQNAVRKAGKIIFRNISRAFPTTAPPTGSGICTLCIDRAISEVNDTIEITNIELAHLDFNAPSGSTGNNANIAAVRIGRTVTALDKDSTDIFTRADNPVPYPTFLISNIRLWDVFVDIQSSSTSDNRIGAVVFSVESGFRAGVEGFLTTEISNLFVARDLSMYSSTSNNNNNIISNTNNQLPPTIEEITSNTSPNNPNFRLSIKLQETFYLSALQVTDPFKGIGETWTRVPAHLQQQNSSFLLISNVFLGHVESFAAGSAGLTKHLTSVLFDSSIEIFGSITFSNIFLFNIEQVSAVSSNLQICVVDTGGSMIGLTTEEDETVGMNPGGVSLTFENLHMEKIGLGEITGGSSTTLMAVLQTLYEIKGFTVIAFRDFFFRDITTEIAPALKGSGISHSEFFMYLYTNRNGLVGSGELSKAIANLSAENFIVDNVTFIAPNAESVDLISFYLNPSSTTLPENWMNILFNNFSASTLQFEVSTDGSGSTGKIEQMLVSLGQKIELRQMNLGSPSNMFGVGTKLKVTNMNTRNVLMNERGGGVLDVVVLYISQKITDYEQVILGNFSMSQVNINSTSIGYARRLLAVRLHQSAQKMIAPDVSLRKDLSYFVFNNVTISDSSVQGRVRCYISAFFTEAAIENYFHSVVSNVEMKNIQTIGLYNTPSASSGATAEHHFMVIYLENYIEIDISASEGRAYGSTLRIENISFVGWRDHGAPNNLPSMPYAVLTTKANSGGFKNYESLWLRNLIFADVSLAQNPRILQMFAVVRYFDERIAGTKRPESWIEFNNIVLRNVNAQPDAAPTSPRRVPIAALSLPSGVAEYHTVRFENIHVLETVINGDEIIAVDVITNGVASMKAACDVPTACAQQPLLLFNNISIRDVVFLPSGAPAVVAAITWPSGAPANSVLRVMFQNILINNVTTPPGISHSSGVKIVAIGTKTAGSEQVSSFNFAVENPLNLTQIEFTNFTISNININPVTNGDFRVWHLGISSLDHWATVRFHNFNFENVKVVGDKTVELVAYYTVSGVYGPANAGDIANFRTSFLLSNFSMKNCHVETTSTDSVNHRLRIANYYNAITAAALEFFVDLKFSSLSVNDVTATWTTGSSDRNTDSDTSFIVTCMHLLTVKGANSGPAANAYFLTFEHIHLHNVKIQNHGHPLTIEPLRLSYFLPSNIQPVQNIIGFTSVFFNDITVINTEIIHTGECTAQLHCILSGALISALPSTDVLSKVPNGPQLHVKNLVIRNSTIYFPQRAGANSWSRLINARFEAQSGNEVFRNFINVLFDNVSIEESSIGTKSILQPERFAVNNIRIYGEVRGNEMNFDDNNAPISVFPLDEHRFRIHNVRIVSSSVENGEQLRIVNVLAHVNDGSKVYYFCKIEFDNFVISNLSIEARTSPSIQSKQITISQLHWYGDFIGNNGELFDDVISSGTKRLPHAAASHFSVTNLLLEKIVVSAPSFLLSALGSAYFERPSTAVSNGDLSYIQNMSTVLLNNITMNSVYVFTGTSSQSLSVVHSVAQITGLSRSLVNSFVATNIHMTNVLRENQDSNSGPSVFNVNVAYFSNGIKNFTTFLVRDILLRKIDARYSSYDASSAASNTDVTIRVLLGVPSSMSDPALSLKPRLHNNEFINRTCEISSISIQDVIMKGRTETYVVGYLAAGEDFTGFDSVSIHSLDARNVTILSASNGYDAYLNLVKFFAIEVTRSEDVFQVSGTFRRTFFSIRNLSVSRNIKISSVIDDQQQASPLPKLLSIAVVSFGQDGGNSAPTVITNYDDVRLETIVVRDNVLVNNSVASNGEASIACVESKGEVHFIGKDSTSKMSLHDIGIENNVRLICSSSSPKCRMHSVVSSSSSSPPRQFHTVSFENLFIRNNIQVPSRTILSLLTMAFDGDQVSFVNLKLLSMSDVSGTQNAARVSIWEWPARATPTSSGQQAEAVPVVNFTDSEIDFGQLCDYSSGSSSSSTRRVSCSLFTISDDAEANFEQINIHDNRITSESSSRIQFAILALGSSSALRSVSSSSSPSKTFIFERNFASAPNSVRLNDSRIVDFYSPATAANNNKRPLENAIFITKCNTWPRSWSYLLRRDFNRVTTTLAVEDSQAVFECSLSESLSVPNTGSPSISLNVTIPVTLTRTKSKILSKSLTDPTNSSSFSISLPVPPAKLLRNAVQQSVKGAGMAMAALSGGANSMNARKIIAISSLADCGKEEIYDEDIPPVEPDSNPLFIRFGTARFDTYRGAIIGAVAFLVLWMVLMCFIGWVRAKIENCSVRRALRKIGVPGTISVPGFCLLPASVNSAASMAKRYYPEEKMDMFIIVFAALTGVVLPLIGLCWIVKEVREHEVLKPEEGGEDGDGDDNDDNDSDNDAAPFILSNQNQNKNADDKYNNTTNNNSKDMELISRLFEADLAGGAGGQKTFDDGSDVPTWKVWFDWLTEPKRDYKRSKFKDAYGPIFDGFTTPWFVLFSFVLVIAAEVTEGAVSLCSKGDRACCQSGLNAILVVSLVDVVSIAGFSYFTKAYVFLVRSDAICVSLCSLIGVANSALIIDQFYSTGVDHTDLLVTMTEIAFYISMTGAGLALVNEVIGASFEVRTVLRLKKSRAALMNSKNDDEFGLLTLSKRKNINNNNNNKFTFNVEQEMKTSPQFPRDQEKQRKVKNDSSSKSKSKKKEPDEQKLQRRSKRRNDEFANLASSSSSPSPSPSSVPRGRRNRNNDDLAAFSSRADRTSSRNRRR